MSDDSGLTRAFCRALPCPAPAEAQAGLDDALARGWALAAQAFDFALAPEKLVSHVASRWDDRPVEAAQIEALHWPDLHLALACALGEPGAVESFERELGHVVDAAVGRLGGSADQRAVAAQRARAHLLVADGNSLPRIAQYSGRAPLASYVRVVASRVALSIARKQPKGRHIGDDALAAIADGDDDPELAYFKNLYRNEFREAFASAVASLTPRERSLLRYQLVERLSLAALSKLYGAPLSTIGRHAQQARARLIENTRDHLRQRLNITPSELDSVLRLVESSADVSVSRLLRTDGPS